MAAIDVIDFCVKRATDIAVSGEAITFSHKRSGGFQLQAERIAIERGRVTCLAGPSSCGKTTLLRLLAGALKPHSGSFCYGRGLQVQGAMIMIPQHEYLIPWATVLRNITFPTEFRPAGARYTNATPAETIARARELCAELNLSPEAYPCEISGGARKRVAFLRALMARPGLLLMDEPLAGLDTRTRDRLLKLIDDEVTGQGTTVVWITHDLDDAALLSTIVYRFKSSGVLDGSPLRRVGGLTERFSNEANETARRMRDFIEG